ncbi:hypothetical protein F5141DRAFT_255288 [Pisolithus sp. B1]|nr:hypothetical protein F5141DRAFT_255288 [Pisolithus sp. B1]
MYCFSYRELSEVMGEDEEVVARISVCIGSCGRARAAANWSVETDNTRMGTIMPGHISLWATSKFTTHHRSFLLIHALFPLSESEPTLERFIVAFLTFFVDLTHHIQEDRHIFIARMRDRTIPDIEHIERVRTYLQANFRANPQQADEPQNIASPLNYAGWAQHV